MIPARHLVIFTVVLAITEARDVRRMGRAKHMFWFKV